MIAAVTVTPQRIRTGLYFSLHVDSNIKAPQVARFLTALVRHFNKPLIIVWDKSRSHSNAKAVKQFQQKHSKVLFYDFPSYAPELNPVEYFWSYLKMNPLANLALTDVHKLAVSFFKDQKTIKNRPLILVCFFFNFAINRTLFMQESITHFIESLEQIREKFFEVECPDGEVR